MCRLLDGDLRGRDFVPAAWGRQREPAASQQPFMSWCLGCAKAWALGRLVLVQGTCFSLRFPHDCRTGCREEWARHADCNGTVFPTCAGLSGGDAAKPLMRCVGRASHSPPQVLSLVHKMRQNWPRFSRLLGKSHKYFRLRDRKPLNL